MELRDGGWQITRHMKCLGHTLCSNGAMAEDWAHTLHTMWGKFFAGVRPGLDKAPLKHSTRMVNTCVKSVASWKWARWPYQRTYAKRLDGLQRHLIGTFLSVPPCPFESSEQYFQRRSTACDRVARTSSLWSIAWARSVVNWREHVERAHDPGAWSQSILNWHDIAWLQEQRVANSTGTASNRTRTRSYQGRPATRWEQGAHDASRALRSISWLL